MARATELLNAAVSCGLLTQHRPGFDDGERCVWRVGVLGETGSDLTQTLQQVITHRRIEGAHGHLQFDVVSDDVALGAALDDADCDDRRVEWIDFATDERLGLDDELRGDDDRVDAAKRHSSVGGTTAKNDIDAICGGLRRAAGETDLTHGNRATRVQRRRTGLLWDTL